MQYHSLGSRKKFFAARSARVNSYARAKQKSATCLEKRFKTNKDITKSFPRCDCESHKESASALQRLTLLCI